MKKTVIFCLILFLHCFVIYPQNGTRILEEQWKNTSKYEINKSEGSNWLEIRNKKNKLYLEEYKPSEKLKEEKGDAIALAMPFHYNRQVSIIATEVWCKKRAEELKEKKELVTLLAYMSDKGEIKEVTFFLSETTMITPQEISLFEAKLKNLTFELRNNDLEGSNYIMISFNVNFKYLLEKYYK